MQNLNWHSNSIIDVLPYMILWTMMHNIMVFGTTIIQLFKNAISFTIGVQIHKTKELMQLVITVFIWYVWLWSDMTNKSTLIVHWHLPLDKIIELPHRGTIIWLDMYVFGQIIYDI
jgi:hypothetical protein